MTRFELILFLPGLYAMFVAAGILLLLSVLTIFSDKVGFLAICCLYLFLMNLVVDIIITHKW